MNEQKPKISIVTVNWWAERYAQLLVDSAVKKAKSANFDFFIVDNSKNLTRSTFRDDCRHLVVHSIPGTNLGHGAGVDYAMDNITSEYVLLLDIDAHILADRWDEKLLAAYNSDPAIKLLAAADGGKLKPVRPLCMFFKKETIIENSISFQAVNHGGVKFDVGIHAYFRILTEYGDKSVGYLPYGKTQYKDVLGTEYTLNGERFIYHNWWSTRWYNVRGERVHDIIDGISWGRFKKAEDNLFKQVV